MKYPLTPEAKAVARELVAAWDEGRVDQLFSITEMHGGDRVMATMLVSEYSDSELDAPLRSILKELSQYKLITLEVKAIDERLAIPNQWEILMLQELRNAVATDFDVSEYFLSLNAVGTIVHGNLTVEAGSNFQSAATNIGDVNQSMEVVADELERTLGDELLQSETQLADAIHELRLASKQPQPTRVQKLGNVMQQLANCLQHTANASVVVAAITYIAQLYYSMPK